MIDQIKGQILSKKQYKFNENMIKGRIAEALIEQLFTSLNYKVFRYGMENTIPGIMGHLRDQESNATKTLRSMPDFVVQNPNGGNVYFVEVKFKKDEKFSLKDVENRYFFENISESVFFIVVSKKHIKCLSYKELKEGKEITPKCHNFLGNRQELGLDRETIIDFCRFAVKFFECVE